MDTVYVSNIAESVLREPIPVQVINIPDTLSVNGTVYVSNDPWSAEAHMIADSISTIRSIITDIAQNQYNISDSVAIIAIPMIIAIIAFAVPYIFDCINRINERYRSTEISDLLEQTFLYKCFWVIVWSSGIGVLIYAILFLLCWRMISSCVQMSLNVILLLVALVLMILTLCLVKMTIRFNKPKEVIEMAIARRKSDLKKKIGHSLYVFYEQTIYTQFYERLYRLWVYAYTSHDMALLDNINYRFLNVIEKQKTTNHKNTSKNNENIYPIWIYEYIDKVVDFYLVSIPNDKIDDELVWWMRKLYDEHCVVSPQYLYKLATWCKKMSDNQRISMQCKYISTFRNAFYKVATLHHFQIIQGYEANVIDESRKEGLINLHLIQMVHMMILAYWMRNNQYELLSTIYQRGKRYVYGTFPYNGLEILSRSIETLENKDYAINYISSKVLFEDQELAEVINSSLAKMLLYQQDFRPEYRGEWVTERFVAGWKKYEKSILMHLKALQTEKMIIDNPWVKCADVSMYFNEYVTRLTMNFSSAPYTTSISPKLEGDWKYKLSIGVNKLNDIVGAHLVQVGSGEEKDFKGRSEHRFTTNNVILPKRLFVESTLDFEKIVWREERRVHELLATKLIYDILSRVESYKRIVIKGNVDKCYKKLKKLFDASADDYVAIDFGSGMESVYAEEVTHATGYMKFMNMEFIDVENYTFDGLKDMELSQQYSESLVIVKKSDLPIWMSDDDTQVSMVNKSDKALGRLDVMGTIDYQSSIWCLDKSKIWIVSPKHYGQVGF